MGIGSSKRSMDVTATPKKEGVPAEGGDAVPAIGDGKLERIGEIDTKPTTNGVAPHIDTPEEKDVKDKDSATEKEKDKNDEETKETEETKVDTQAESPTEGDANVTTPTEETASSPTSVSSPKTKESKKKEKPKKKWSFRSISFSKKDKNKPVREESPKNGDVSKDEPLTESGEDAENTAVSAATAVAATATAAAAAGVEANEAEEKTSTSPTESSSTPVVDEKEDDKAALSQPPSSGTTAEASSTDDMNEATVAAPSSPIAPTPVPVEAKNDEAEKEVEKKTVESIDEPEAPVEKNAVTNDSMTETIEDSPKNVITEAPISPSTKAPMISEDVASVTKAVEEIDINEKAVAAAVNENIECTKNEIIAEMNHQNNLNE